ncbi:MAG: TlyA family rRNA (cytidine-2'-O)-methyltransferase [Rhodospirillaceae bacterium]|nr:TlyA family rRNA (cytidine-2'-O)-methyltransferase [Rhodospirillaceae bacterium]|tara:strand:- start:165 stop:914 length:750 start_codon:yes stop_codon:yes gene_type:complete
MKTPNIFRLDDLLVLRQMAKTKTQAKACIMAGLVFHGSTRLDKPGHKVKADIQIHLREKPHPWVSRGGIKLAHAIDHFQLSINQKVCMDIGSSTGGFTDVLLSKGAKKVYAIDSGKGQLDWGLRNTEKVVALERTNARHLTSQQIPEAIEIITCDASFISLTKILPTPLTFAKTNAFLIALIKPQFETSREHISKGGVVRDPQLHNSACKKIHSWITIETPWTPLGIEPSPITGPKGNREFLIVAQLQS